MAEQRLDQRLVRGVLHGLAQHRHGGVDLARFEQDLALQFENERIVRQLPEQGVGLGGSKIGIGRTVPGIGAGDMRRIRPITGGEAGHHLCRRIDETDQLGTNPQEARL
jgi:hypothetical protein